MAETKLTAAPGEAAQNINFRMLQGDLSISEIKSIIDRKVTIPLQARIDRLEAEKAELLKACKAVESCWGLTDEICEQIRAAIAKADPKQPREE